EAGSQSQGTQGTRVSLAASAGTSTRRGRARGTDGTRGSHPRSGRDHEMLARIRKAAEEREGGFTLIELLVVIIIIGILAAIAIPVFLNQRQKGYDAGIKSDLKNAATVLETLATDDPTGASTTADPTYYDGTVSTGNVAKAGFKKSSGNTIQIAGS